MIENLFYNLGYSEKEAKIYMILLQYGSLPASTLARLSGIKRTSIYDVANSLLEKNVVTSFKQGSYIYYGIDDPNKIYLAQKENLSTAKLLVERLNETTNSSKAIMVNYYKGAEGYKAIYDDILKQKPKEILVWMNWENFSAMVGNEEEDDWTNERLANNIFGRLLLSDSKAACDFAKRDANYYRETRILPTEYVFSTTSMLYDGYITFFDSTDPISAIRINNKNLYEMMKQMFEFTWTRV